MRVLNQVRYGRRSDQRGNSRLGRAVQAVIEPLEHRVLTQVTHFQDKNSLGAGARADFLRGVPLHFNFEASCLPPIGIV
jgi:hypothetical protein